MRLSVGGFYGDPTGLSIATISMGFISFFKLNEPEFEIPEIIGIRQ